MREVDQSVWVEASSRSHRFSAVKVLLSLAHSLWTRLVLLSEQISIAQRSRTAVKRSALVLVQAGAHARQRGRVPGRRAARRTSEAWDDCWLFDRLNQSCVLGRNVVIWWVSPAERLPPRQTTPSLIWQTAVYFWSALRASSGVQNWAHNFIIFWIWNGGTIGTRKPLSRKKTNNSCVYATVGICLAYKWILASTQPLKCCASSCQEEITL